MIDEGPQSLAVHNVRGSDLRVAGINCFGSQVGFVNVESGNYYDWNPQIG